MFWSLCFGSRAGHAFLLVHVSHLLLSSTGTVNPLPLYNRDRNATPPIKPLRTGCGVGESDMAEENPMKRPRSVAKKLSDKERNKTRVNIGLAFPRWRALREEKGIHFDSELALLLLDQ